MIKRKFKHQKKTINEINMVPFIDVMLVLLIIFMVTAPLITPSIINLPSVGESANKPATKIIEILITENQPLNVKIDNSQQVVDLPDLASFITEQQTNMADNTSVPVVISADKTVEYDKVIQVMDILRQANIERIGLAVKHQKN